MDYLSSPNILSVNQEYNLLPTTSDFPEWPESIEIIKHEFPCKKGEIKTSVLLRTPLKQILLTVMHHGIEVYSYQSNHFITIQILEGELKFKTTGNTVLLTKGHLLTLHENIHYSLTSKTMTAFLLTIHKKA